MNSLNELSNPFKAHREEILVYRVDEIVDKQNINNIKDCQKNTNVPIGNIFINNIINQQDNKNENNNENINHGNNNRNNNDNGIVVKENEDEEEIEYEDEEIEYDNDEIQFTNKNININNNFDNNNNLQNKNKILYNENKKLFHDQSNNLNNNSILTNDQNFYDKTSLQNNENKIGFDNNQLSSSGKNVDIKEKIFPQNINDNLIVNENQQQNSLLIKNSNEIENKKITSNERYLAALLYGILFGTTSIGIYWLRNKSKRDFLYDKVKNINFNSIINLFKHLLHPITFFKSIFNSDKWEIYKKVFAFSLIKFFDFLEQYGDEFRILGKFIFIYGFWLIFKTLIRTSLNIWKYYTK